MVTLSNAKDMKLFVLVCCSFALASGQLTRTVLDTGIFLDKFRLSRMFLLDFSGRTGENQADWNTNLRNNNLQKQFTASEPFFCDVNGPGKRSPTPPQSVHELRPGDIDIIGAMGDSLTAGNGGLATNIVQITTENKGLSWTIGGQKTWRQFLTIPNILKEYNPNLYGYSLTDGLSTIRSSRFNVAEIGAMSRDIPHQARVLLTRMKNDPNVDMENHWKMVSILIGPNDFCLDMCYYPDPEIVAVRHGQELTAALRTLRDNLPRTFVNVIVSPSMDVLLRIKGKSAECSSTHYLECPCFFSGYHSQFRRKYLNVIKKWQEVQKAVVYSPEFQNSTTFTAVLQPFTERLRLPKTPAGTTDFSYMSKDCFHFSQKGYAIATNALWNNILDPVGSKANFWKREFTDFRCPTSERPFLATNANSRKR